MRSTVKFNLDLCIAMNDLTRLKKGERPIKTIHRLALIIETRYDLDYDIIIYQLYKAQKKGYKQHDKVEGLEVLIEKTCLVLGVTRDDLVNEIEH